MVQLPEIHQLLLTMVRSLVENEDAVVVDQTNEESSVVFKVTVAPYDVPKVCGVDGRNANALRWLVRAVAPTEIKLLKVEVLGFSD